MSTLESPSLRMSTGTFKQKVVAKLSSKLVSKSGVRALIIDLLLNNHVGEVLAAICREPHLLHNTLDAMCRHRLDDMITFINSSTDGRFKYVGDGNVKVIIGAGSQQRLGWLATDINRLNVVQEASWRNLFKPNSINNVLAEHVIEHLSLEEFGRVLGYVRAYLKPGGIFRIAVPDAFHPSRYYYNLVKPGGWETPEQHKVFYDYEMMTRIAEGSGFRVRLLEYFDERGRFHKEQYSEEDGAIQRCAGNNCGLDTSNDKIMEEFYSTISNDLRQQFYDHKMTYTSLIVDLIK